jgi:hypothetical protein
MLMPLLVGIVLACWPAAAGFWAVTSGPLAPATASAMTKMPPVRRRNGTVDAVFVSLDPSSLPLGPRSQAGT